MGREHLTGCRPSENALLADFSSVHSEFSLTVSGDVVSHLHASLIKKAAQ